MFFLEHESRMRDIERKKKKVVDKILILYCSQIFFSPRVQNENAICVFAPYLRIIREYLLSIHTIVWSINAIVVITKPDSYTILIL